MAINFFCYRKQEKTTDLPQVNRGVVGGMVFNATFNNISVISWQSFILVEETGVPKENQRPSASHWQTFITQCCIKYTSPWVGFKLTTLVVIGTDCIGSCKSNYHMIMTTPLWVMTPTHVKMYLLRPYQ